MEQIYINGQLMQLGEGNPISLIFQSPFFTDIENIVSNRTTSVDLPRTAGNMKAIELAGLPQGTSLFEYNLHDAVYLRDGIQIFKGKATLLSITSSTIKVSFTWGNIDAFQNMLDDYLQDLQTEDDNDYVGWDIETVGKNPQYYPFGWNTPDNWSDAENPNDLPIMPIIAVEEILQRISTKYGVTFEYPDNATPFSKYHIPLTRRVGNAKSAKGQASTFSNGESAFTEISLQYRAFLTTPNIDLGGLMLDGEIDLTSIDRFNIEIEQGFYIEHPTITPSFEIYVSTSTNEFESFLDDIQTSLTTVDGKKRLTVTAPYSKTITTQAMLDAGYEIAYIQVGTTSSSTNAATAVTYGGGTFKVWNPDLDVLNFGEGAIYPLFLNLPEWTISDFIKNIMHIEGLFSFSTQPNVVRFVDIDLLYQNRENAIDWSNKLMNTNNIPMESVAGFNDLARKNWMRYAEDDSVTKNFDAYIEVQSNTIAEEKDLIQLDFAPTQGKRIVVWKDNGGDVEYQEVEPRILRTQDFDYMSFANMSWETLIANNYATYANIIQRPRTVKTSVLLSTLEVAQFDPSIPVYARQWGHYYAVMKLTTKNDGMADVELLELGDAVQYPTTN